MKNKLVKSACSLALAAALSACSDIPELQVYSWSDYFDPELVELFEQTYRCRVVITSFDSNEAMYAKLKSGGNGYDLIVPSSYLIPTLVKEGMLAPISTNLLPNVVEKFDHRLDKQILDPSFSWSVPYACTYTGIMYDKKHAASVKSWNDLGAPSNDGRVSLLDDVRELVAIGLIHNGRSVNETNRVEIMKAAEYVMGLLSNVRKFDAEAYKNDVANGSIWLGHGYSSDAAQVILGDDRDDIGFALPDEGFVIAWDEFVIPANANNPILAHAFIDFFSMDLVAYKNMLYICSLVPNQYAIRNMSDEYRKILMPANLGRGQLLRGFDDAQTMDAYNQALDLIKSAKPRTKGNL